MNVSILAAHEIAKIGLAASAGSIQTAAAATIPLAGVTKATEMLGATKMIADETNGDNFINGILIISGVLVVCWIGYKIYDANKSKIH
jgi:hypothetical protein